LGFTNFLYRLLLDRLAEIDQHCSAFGVTIGDLHLMAEELSTIFSVLEKEDFKAYHSLVKSEDLTLICVGLYERISDALLKGMHFLSATRRPETKHCSEMDVGEDDEYCHLCTSAIEMHYRHVLTLDDFWECIQGKTPLVLSARKSKRDTAYKSSGKSWKPMKKPPTRKVKPKLTDAEVAMICHCYCVAQAEYDFGLLRGSGCMSARCQQLLQQLGSKTVFCEQWYLRFRDSVGTGENWLRASPFNILNTMARLLPKACRNFIQFIVDNIGRGLDYRFDTTHGRDVLFGLIGCFGNAQNYLQITYSKKGNIDIIRQDGPNVKATYGSVLELVVELAGNLVNATDTGVVRVVMAVLKCLLGHDDLKYYCDGRGAVALHQANRWKYTFLQQIIRATDGTKLKMNQARRPDLVVVDNFGTAKESVREVLDLKFCTSYRMRHVVYGYGEIKGRDKFKKPQYYDFRGINGGVEPIEVTFETVGFEPLAYMQGSKSAPFIDVCECGLSNDAEELSLDLHEVAIPSDDVLVSIGGYGIRQSDRDSVDRGNYLTDYILAIEFEVLQARHGGDFAFVSPVVAHQVMHGADQAAALANLMDVLSGDEELVFLPVNNENPGVKEGDHWTLLIWDRRDNSFHYYDTLNPINPPLGNNIAQRLHNLLALPGNLDYTYHRAPQQNEPDCGIYVIMMADLIAEVFTGIAAEEEDAQFGFADIVSDDVGDPLAHRRAIADAIDEFADGSGGGSSDSSEGPFAMTGVTSLSSTGDEEEFD